jgi:DNA-binding MarR family transcriptional regulator
MLLASLVCDGPRRASALADAVYSDPSTVSRQVAHLVRTGLVERRSDPEDGRVSVLAATEKGAEVLEEHRRRRNAAISAVVADWPEEDRHQFAALLTRFAADYERRLPEVIATCTAPARGAHS